MAPRNALQPRPFSFQPFALQCATRRNGTKRQPAVPLSARFSRGPADGGAFDASKSLWWPRRPLATLGRKLRQGRKAATVLTDAGAEVSRRGHRPFWAPPITAHDLLRRSRVPLSTPNPALPRAPYQGAVSPERISRLSTGSGSCCFVCNINARQLLEEPTPTKNRHPGEGRDPGR